MVYFVEDSEGNLIQQDRDYKDIFLHNSEIINRFLQTKHLEGLSKTTLDVYKLQLLLISREIGKRFEEINVNDMREFMARYQEEHNIKNRSMDNLRRVLNSFYNFMEEEDYVMKSPMKKIHKIKEEKIIKSPFTEEEVVIIQDACRNIRETALIDFLYITGVRVSELCTLNIKDIDFDKQEAIVFGKGSKERVIYFDSRTKIHLQKYLKRRIDDNPALFVTSDAPYTRLGKNGVEYIVKQIGLRAGINNCHPHRFRRTLAIRMIDRGVPIEQVQRILGHSKIETTLIYA